MLGSDLVAQEIKIDYYSVSKAMTLRRATGVILEDTVYDKKTIYGYGGRMLFASASVRNVETGAVIPYIYVEGNASEGRPCCTIDYDELKGLIDAINGLLETRTEMSKSDNPYMQKYYGTRDGFYVCCPTGEKWTYNYQFRICFLHYRHQPTAGLRTSDMESLRDLLVEYKEYFDCNIDSKGMEQGQTMTVPETKSNELREL